MMERFIDSNSDGIISDEEAAERHEEMFAMFDSNEVGQLTSDEFLSMQMGSGMGIHHEQRQTEKSERFEAMDSDSDGLLSQAEFLQAGQQWYENSDLDGDGRVSVWEYRSQRRTWQ